MKRVLVALAALAFAAGGADSDSAKPYVNQPQTQPTPSRRWSGSQGWGHNAQYFALYDPDAIDTISGVVEHVDRQTPLSDMYYGVFLVVDSEDEDYDLTVHLGPGWYIDNQDTEVKRGDSVTVAGSRIVLEGEPAIIAAEVTLGNKVLRLRERDGMPVWVGWRDRENRAR